VFSENTGHYEEYLKNGKKNMKKVVIVLTRY
jgi:hypothetical protein